MPRGNASQSKVHYQGKEEDFVIYIDDIESVQKWKGDRSIPLAQVRTPPAHYTFDQANWEPQVTVSGLTCSS